MCIQQHCQKGCWQQQPSSISKSSISFGGAFSNYYIPVPDSTRCVEHRYRTSTYQYQYQLDTTTNFEFGHLDLLEHHRHPIISIIHSHSTGSASAASTWKHVRLRLPLHTTDKNTIPCTGTVAK